PADPEVASLEVVVCTPVFQGQCARGAVNQKTEFIERTAGVRQMARRRHSASMETICVVFGDVPVVECRWLSPMSYLQIVRQQSSLWKYLSFHSELASLPFY